MGIDTPEFWTALLKIIGVNIVLSGDNAVVIALAARSLPPKQQKQAIFWGSAAAIIMRIVLTLFAVALLGLPWLKLIGSVLLLWIGVKLLLPEAHEPDIDASDNLWAAIKTILIADLVMSVDNVIAVAAAAGGHWGLLMIGLAISIPLVIFGATLLLKLMERWPIIITIGAGLLGFVAGEMAWEDQGVEGFTSQFPAMAKYVVALIGAAFVVGLGRILAGRSLKRSASEHLEHQGGHPVPEAKTPAE
ncbi:MAG: TerC family protein [Burkholderiales bacterium]|nr:TerC family protein [Burkholderiales bacterium]